MLRQPATVGNSNNLRSAMSTLKLRRKRATTRVARSEWPPSSKKLSCTPILSSFRYFAPDLRDQFFNFGARFNQALIELWPLSIRAAAGHCGRSFR